MPGSSGVGRGGGGGGGGGGVVVVVVWCSGSGGGVVQWRWWWWWSAVVVASRGGPALGASMAVAPMHLAQAAAARMRMPWACDDARTIVLLYPNATVSRSVYSAM